MLNNTEIRIDDNEIYWCHFFLLLNRNISKYGMGLIWIVGNIGSTMNCFIFLQSNLRKNPCVMYFLASSASQFLTFNFALLTRILQFGHNIQAVNTYLWFCKIRYYLFYVFVAIPRYYIILASIDRYFASSSDINRRRWSSPKIALRLIIGNSLFWCLMYIQVLIFYEIDNNDCSFRNGIYGMFFSIYIIIDSGIFPLAIMLICGLLTINNIRKIKSRIRPLRVVVVIQPVRLARISRKDLQFSRMLLNQICIWIILNLINPCYLLYRTLTDNIIKSPLRLTIELLINNMSYFLIYLGFSLTFFVYTLSSSMFRREFYRLIRRKLLHHFI
ncbi:unnamed protein product [Adineta steineri]|uniref:G-protein coupled receptors family 1 profile domain-containing protein n=1 Tax=Adineta steineri TaxID=433720 RepID=A0A814V1N4_9BILA|nr:unnamed protein product [Adineta steineri]CAF1292433.1 unnamed protein product [Adineta steineri]